MPYLDLSGERIYYALHHNAPHYNALQRNSVDQIPVLLIHGAGENHLVWPIGLRRLPGTIVYAIDLPGHGKSAGTGRSTIEAYVDWLAAFIDALPLKAVSVIGHSMGGAIAQLFALKHPDRMLNLVLVATGAKLRVAPQLLDLAENDFPAAVELVTQWEWGPLTSEEIRRLGKQQLLTNDSGVMLSDYRACDAFDVRERLGEIATPTLIIAGEADQLTPLKHALFLAERLPHAQLITMPQAGHMVMLEAEEQVVQAVTLFLQEGSHAA